VKYAAALRYLGVVVEALSLIGAIKDPRLLSRELAGLIVRTVQATGKFSFFGPQDADELANAVGVVVGLVLRAKKDK